MTIHVTPEQRAQLDAAIQSIRQDPYYIAPALREMLASRYEAGRRNQIAKGVQFDLTFEDFLKLISPWKRNKIQQAMDRNVADSFFKSNSGYVLTWKDRDSYRAGVMNADTAAYVNRNESRKVNQFKHGDVHSEESKAKIAAAKTGKPRSEATKGKIAAAHIGSTKSEETRRKMSEAKKGRVKSPEERQRISESMKAARAARRAVQ